MNAEITFILKGLLDKDPSKRLSIHDCIWRFPIIKSSIDKVMMELLKFEDKSTHLDLFFSSGLLMSRELYLALKNSIYC
jgi:hypothetical protein